MFTQLRTLLAAGFLVALLTAPAMAENGPRIPLDWEPDPDHPSMPVKICICGSEKIVGLIGGTEIRERKLATNVTARAKTQRKSATTFAVPPARRTNPLETPVVRPRMRGDARPAAELARDAIEWF